MRMEKMKNNQTQTKKQNRCMLGTSFEQEAARFLEQQGFVILMHNYQTRSGEIDLIAEEHHTICFIEVKYRADTGYGYPAEAVGACKQARILQTAENWLLEHAEDAAGKDIRFDVVEILGKEIRLLRNAFWRGAESTHCRRRFP